MAAHYPLFTVHCSLTNALPRTFLHVPMVIEHNCL